MCIFCGPVLALDGPSTRTDPFTSGKKYCKSVNNADFIRNESIFFVSAVATCAFQLQHMPRLLHRICPAGYEICDPLSENPAYPAFYENRDKTGNR